MKSVAKAAITVAAGAAVTAGLYLFSLSPRRDQPGWAELQNHRYAHRGLHDLDEGRPENSLSAFRAAVDAGFGAELDVHLMRDGNLAVVHDSDLTRVTGIPAKIEELTAEELPGYPLKGSGETIPLFEDVLSVFNGRTPLIVELKTSGGNAPALTDAVMERLSTYNGLFCVESFDPHVLMCLKARYPDVIRGQLSENFMRSRPSAISAPLRFAMSNLLTTFLTKPDFIAYNWIDRGQPSLKMMKSLYGVHEVSWTVRDPDLQSDLESQGAVTIFEGFVPDHYSNDR